MDALHYKPSEIARSLAGKQTSTVALIVPDILNPFFPEIAKSMELAATQYGYTLILCNSGDDGSKEADYFSILKQKKIDGIVLASYTARPEQLAELQQSIPIVVIDNRFEKKYGIPSIISQNKNGAVQAVRHLAELGCRKIAHLCGPNGVVSAMDRLTGFKEECSRQGLFDPELMEQGDYHLEGGYQAARQLLARRPDVDAIFAGNDLMAVGALKALYEAGLSVPGDVKLIGFDGVSLPLVFPQLSTVAQPIAGMGRKAMDLLVHLIRDESVPRSVIEMEVTLKVGHSTGGNFL
ncbi:LacI family DNA-binding transcriptional regulator [Paenibacillus senegalensis]|uniref:LacI family DNA-binding transcriptional regulator n=1 Tax=Paenibacillus senegalensis TaxID=1465766 RepID=UPI00031415C1|nr:LacI family DNA-binding transcriptional regulator [Paenibacillus senegalensis]